MRLIVFCPLYPPSVGGLQNHAEQWNRELVKLGYGITVVTPHVAGGPDREVTPEGVTVLRFPAFELIPNWPVPKLWQWRFWHLWQAREPSNQNLKIITVSRTRFFITSLMALVFSTWHRLPWLHIEHGSDYVQLNNRFLQLLAKLYDHTFGRLVLRSATKIVANSKASAAFVKKLSGCQAEVIYRGIDVARINRIPRTSLTTTPYNLPPAPSTITYAGRLIDGKGVTDLLVAFSQLPAAKYQLLLIGDGPQRVHLEKLASELKIADHVHFLGEKSWEETIALLKSTDIFVNPSYTEGLPSSVIEAVLCGCRVVATDVGGTCEIPGVNLVPPRAPGQLAKAIQRTLSEASTSIPNNLRQQFSWSASAQRYHNLLSIQTS